MCTHVCYCIRFLQLCCQPALFCLLSSHILPLVTPDYSNLIIEQLEIMFAAGTRVIRGKDWSWGNQDGGIGSQGTVQQFSRTGLQAQVKWDKGGTYYYRMGAAGKYDLARVAGEGSLQMFHAIHVYGCCTCLVLAVKESSSKLVKKRICLFCCAE